MSIFKFFSPAPFIERIKDENKMKSTYTHWRWRIFFGMYIGYAVFYLTRKSLPLIMPAIVDDLGFTKAQVGILGSILYMVYGASKFLSGIIADRSNPRYFMAMGLIATGLLNLFIGGSSTLVLFAVFWGLNGWFQGWGWPPCARLLTHWYGQQERGRWWGFWNTSHNVGGAIIPLLATSIAAYFGWRYAMYAPGVIAIGIGLLVLYSLRDTPQSLGLPPIEEYYDKHILKSDDPKEEEDDAVEVNDEGDKLEEERELTAKEQLFTYVLKNKYVWILAFAYFFVYIIRTAVNDWGPFYLIEYKGHTLISAGATILMFEIGGLIGSLVAGWVSDKLFHGRRGPINVLYSIGVIISLFMLWTIPNSNTILSSIAMFSIGFMVFGPQMLIGVAAAELSHKKAAATATGFAGWFGYFGAAFSAYPFGSITQEFGWQGFFFALAICGVMSVLLLLPLWFVKTNPQHALSTSN